MVSNARLDLPEPESPVTTTSLSRGISTEMFLRLCTRAPCTKMVVRAFGRDTCGEDFGLELIGCFLQIEEREFLHGNIAPFRKLHRRGRLSDQFLIGQVFARRDHSLNAEVASKIILDFR